MTKPQNDVGEMLSQVHSEEKQRNGRMLMNIMQNVQFLGRQGIALRGYNESQSRYAIKPDRTNGPIVKVYSRSPVRVLVYFL